jgi:hypothetical protein
VREVFLPFRSPIRRPVHQVRSTLILNGIQTLRAHGFYSRYLDLLGPETRDQIMSLVAGLWIPIDLPMAHYRAADRLNLDPALIESIGAEVADRVYKTALSSIPALSKRSDVTPWSVLSLAHQNNDTNWKGSDIIIYKEGPREAIYEWTGQPMADVPYFVRSWGGFLRSMTNLFCTKASYHLINERCTTTTISIRLSWL